MTKLDVKDRKLLYHLSRNSRLSYTQLSKRIGLSKNAVKYRIERLKREGVVKKFASVVNLRSLGLSTVAILFKFNDDVYENKAILDYFVNHDYSSGVVTLSGQWDVFAEFVWKDINHLHNILNGILEYFGDVLNSYETFSSLETLRVEHLVSSFYEDLDLEEIKHGKRSYKKYDIDEVDKKILEMLNEDSSMHFLDIAKRINSSIDVVRYRIKNMMDSEIIIKCFSEIDLSKLGYTEYVYTLKLRNISNEELNKVKRKLQEDKNIAYAFYDVTRSHFVFVCAFKKAKDIDHLSRSIRKEYSDVIEAENYFIVTEQNKFNLFPKGLVG
ncbi:MAG: winged helix-turn-helix transcriptional regulator [Candidatus Nanoarchaeia archaeon]